MTKLQLQEKRELIKKQYGELLDKAITENRELTEDENNEVRSFEATIKNIDKQIDMIGDTEERSVKPVVTVDTEKEKAVVETRDLNQILRSQEIRSIDQTVPVTTVSDVWQRAVNGSFMRSLGVSFDVVATNEDIPVTATPLTIGLVTEGQADAYGSLSDPLGVKTFRAKITGGVLALPESYVMDSAVNLSTYFSKEASDALAEWENKAYFTGDTDGTTSISGLAGEGTAWSNIAGTAAITFSELLKYRLALPAKYRAKGAVIAMHSSTLEYIIGLNDGNNRYLVHYNDAKGYYHLDGVRIVENDNVAELGASAKVMYFFSPYACKGVDRENMQVKKYEDSAYGNKGQVGYRLKARTDFHLMDASACQIMTMAAS